MTTGARLSGFAIAFILATPGGAAAQDCGASELARGLMKNIPSGASLALIPFGQPATAVPAEEADRLYDCIARALQEASNGRHKFVARDRRDAIWRDWQSEGEKSDYLAFWKKRNVSVTVRCEPKGQSGNKLKLSCTAHPVGADSPLPSDLYGPLAAFDVDSRFGYEYELNQAALQLAKAAPKRISKAFVVDAETGQRSRLTRDMESRIRLVLTDRFDARRRDIEGRRNLGLDGEAAAGSYELRGEMTWPTKDVARLAVRLWEGNADIARTQVEISREHLPPGFLEAGTGTPRYSMSARAVPSEDFRAESAKRAVKNVARARVVAQAFGLQVPPEVVRSEADAMQALRRALEHGMPAGERFSAPRKAADGAWEIDLEARVVPVGGTVRPEFEARLSKDVLRTNEYFSIEFSAREDVNVAVFAWGADGNVIRLYPHFLEPEPMVTKGGRLSLPQDSRCKLAAAPLPGARESHEAVIVIASGERQELKSLAPPFCYRPGEQPPKPVPGDTFLDKLSELDLSRAGLSVLPYRVGK